MNHGIAIAGTQPPPGRVRRLLGTLDRYRWIAYLALATTLLVLPAFLYIHKLAGLEAAPPLPAEWTSTVRGDWDFSGALRGHRVSYANLPVAREDGTGWSVLGWSFYGAYDPWTGDFRLAEDLLEDGADNSLMLTARHEVGHALLDDIVAEGCGDGFGGYLRAMLIIQSTKAVTRKHGAWITAFYPADLQAVYRAYMEGPAAGNGGGNGDANLNEYFAEGYAGQLTGFEQHPDLRAVLASHAAPGSVPPSR